MSLEMDGSVLLQPDEEGLSSQDILSLEGQKPRKKKKLIHRAQGKDAQEKAAEDFQAKASQVKLMANAVLVEDSPTKASQVDGGVLLVPDEEGYSSQEFSTFCDDFEKAAEDSQVEVSQVEASQVEASQVEALPSQPRTRKARPLKPEPESPARS